MVSVNHTHDGPERGFHIHEQWTAADPDTACGTQNPQPRSHGPVAGGQPWLVGIRNDRAAHRHLRRLHARTSRRRSSSGHTSALVSARDRETGESARNPRFRVDRTMDGRHEFPEDYGIIPVGFDQGEGAERPKLSGP